MFELSSQTRIADLRSASTVMFDALKSTGMYRDGDDPSMTIDDLCFRFGLNPQIILNVLARAGASEPAATIDVSDLDGLTLTGVVENIEQQHHDYLRAALPKISQLLDEVVTDCASEYPRLADVQTLLLRMADELESHMQHEEEALFPMVRDIESAGDIAMTRCGNSVGGPIACMENDHKLAHEQLSVLRQWTNNYTLPANADSSLRELFERLAEFDQNTVVHIHKEDHVLFPGALKAQKALRLRTATG